MKRLLACWLALCGLLAFGPATARADLITFDDLPGPTLSPIPNGYHGLLWTSFWSANPIVDHLAPGYVNAVVSAPNVAINAFGNPAEIAAATPFDFKGASITSAWNDGLKVEIQGFKGATMLYDQTFTVNTSGPTTIVVNYQNVDNVTFIASGGTPHGDISGRQFAIDNLRVDARLTKTPEPTSLVLLAVGGAVCALANGRRRRRGR